MFFIVDKTDIYAVARMLPIIISSLSLRIMAKIHTNEREISSLLEYFSQRVQNIFDFIKDTYKRARNIKFT